MKREKTDTNTEQIVVRVSPAMKERVEAYCHEHGLSIADAVRCWALSLPDPKKEKRRDALRKKETP